MRDGCLGGGWWALGRDGRVLGRGRVGVRAEEGAGGSYTARREECGKKWKAEKFILLEIPRKAAAAALKHGNSPTESGTPEG